jgi:predicted acetyltransferase
VAVSVRDARRSPADRAWIESVYRDYLNDLAPLSTGLFPTLGEIGHREPDQLARWFGDPTAFPFVILDGEERAGFAMIGRGSTRADASTVDFRMGEFFVVAPHRRRGVGRSAVQIIFDRLCGKWEILEYLRNPGAVSFWRKVVGRYTQGRYQERIANGEVRQVFDSGGPARPSRPA